MPADVCIGAVTIGFPCCQFLPEFVDICYPPRKTLSCHDIKFYLWYLFTALRDDDPLPAPSSLDEINPAAVLKDFEMESATENAFVNMVLVDMIEYAR